jgi:hypothetical protein
MEDLKAVTGDDNTADIPEFLPTPTEELEGYILQQAASSIVSSQEGRQIEVLIDHLLHEKMSKEGAAL